jgi:hypothetical protein
MKIIKFIINVLTLIIALNISFILMLLIPIEIIVLTLLSFLDNKNYFLIIDPIYTYVFDYWKENIYLK